MAEAKNAATINRLMSERQSVLYFPYSTLFSRVKGHKGSPVLPRLLPSIVMGSLLRRAHFESLRPAEAKNSATINQLKYHSRSCITENIALGAWSRANKALVQYSTVVSLPEMLHSYILLILQDINFYNTCIVHGRNFKSHSPQCLQCLVDFEGFSQSHTSFISNVISIKTVIRPQS